jgi:RNA polymerase subunit RPABC4/transcription elongation factor Spt4
MTKYEFVFNKIGNFRTDYTEALYCPRCAVRLLPFGYPGALSRVDNKTEICSECGQEEALSQWAGFTLGPTESWPIKKVGLGSPSEK